MRKFIPHIPTLLVMVLLFGVSQVLARPQPNATPTALPSAFTYQGQLLDAGQPTDGSYDLTFRLYDALSDGKQIGGAVALTGVAVSQGIFTVQLDFGPGAFTDARYLEIQVGTTTLSPRQPITPAPAALYAASVPWSGVSGVPADLADGDNVGMTSVSWGDISNRPAGLDDGDQDTTTIPWANLTDVPTDLADGDNVGMTSVSWSDITNIPTDLADGDQDTTTIPWANLTGVPTDLADGDNVGMTSVSWSDITNIPTDLADGDQDTTTIPWANLTGVPTDLADGDNVGMTSVSWGDISNRPAGLDDGDQDTTTIPWANLTGVPTDLADGDNDTTYSAGVGMTLNGTTFNVHYAQVIVVAQSGGDYTSIQAALDSITDAGVGKPYLVYVAPGVYEERVTMKAYVTIEGAGEGATIIRWSGGSTNPLSESGSATLEGANNATLRHLSVESIAGAGTAYAVGIHNNSVAPTISNVTVTVSGGNFNYGIHNISSSSPTISNVTITIPSGSVSVGIFNYAASPTISNVTVAASGEINSYGIVSYYSTPTISNVTVTAYGGTNNYGISNTNASPTISNVTVTASGGTNNYGIFNIFDSSPTITNVTVTASGGTYSYGIQNNFSASPTIRDSAITGSTNSVYNDNSTAKVAYSMLNGPLSTGMTCIGNYNVNFASVTCP
ncbi:hypothetical protein [Candidatus Oscillochloris fontis]|uniref:hypothetical protein n=1 Tax=Candidatus Oscillochloris fontis TaxID=2496868 RepID=UPI001EE876C2|nr:hypothetical protein [Candidatus Oscillochloris fontis]